jgi:hypothetical protein
MRHAVIQVAIAIVLVAGAWAAGRAQSRVGDFEAVLHWWIPQGVAYTTVCFAALIHHLWAWRCSRCGAYQGQWIFEATCATCGLTTVRASD